MSDNNNGTSQTTRDDSLVASIYINFPITAACILLFLLIRKKLIRVYHASPVYEIPKSYLIWLYKLLNRRYDDILEHCGLDALSVIIVVKNIIFILILWFLYGFLITIPVDATAAGRYLPPEDLRHVQGLAIISIGAISDIDRERFWAHTIQVVFNSIVACFFLLRMFNQYRTYRQKLWRYPCSYQYTTCFYGIKKSIAAEDQLFQYLNSLFPSEIVAVHRCPKKDVRKLLKKKYKRAQLIDELEAYKATKPSEHKQSFASKYCGAKDKDEHYYQEKIQQVEDDIVRLQKEAVEAELSDVAYVTFKHVVTARACSEIYLKHAMSQPAPEPYNVRWHTHLRRPLETFIYWITNIVILFLLIFYIVPVGFAVTLSHLDTLAVYAPFLRPILQYPTLVEIINGVLPSLVIVLAFIILKKILYALLDLTKPLSHSKLHGRVYKKLFIFYVINVFFVSIIGNSFLGIVNSVFGVATQFSFYDVLLLLARSIPSQATYFMNYLITSGITGQAIAILRPGDIVIRYLRKAMSKTPRQHAKARIPNHALLNEDLALVSLFFLIVAVFSTIVPLILVFAMIYFTLVWIRLNIQTAFVTRQHFEGFGYLFVPIFDRLCICLMLYQLVLAGIFLINTFYEGFGISLACFFLTVAFQFYVKSAYFEITKFGYMDDWVRCDELQLPNATEDYKHPALWPPGEDIEDINDIGGQAMLKESFEHEVV